MFHVLVLTFATIVGVYAQVPSSEKCPPVTPLVNFNATEYMGKWFEYSKYFVVFEIGGKCVTAQYKLQGDRVEVINGMINTLTDNKSSIEGYAKLVSDKDARLVVIFPSLPVKVEAPYWVVDTDYVSYSVVWSCTDIASLSLRYAWILTRERFPSKETIDKAYEAFEKQNIPTDKLSKTNQKDCPEVYP